MINEGRKTRRIGLFSRLVSLLAVCLRFRASMDTDLHIDGQASMLGDSSLQKCLDEVQGPSS